MNTKKDILNFGFEELCSELKKIGESSYRASQIFNWLYVRGAMSFDEMTNLSKSLREKLKEYYAFPVFKLREQYKSNDGVEKFVFQLYDSSCIETVLIKSKERKTICLSTQSGCKFSCAFCSSGALGFNRSLKVSEILEQILYIQYVLKNKITNYVFMGIGEPLDNYDNLVKALQIMNDPKGLNAGARRITVSTCGVIPGIEALKNFDMQINLSISLHATNDKTRSMIMPVNKLYPISKLLKACKHYFDKTNRIITFEYTLIKGVNDSANDADKLADMVKDLDAKVNIIPYSPSVNKKFEPSPEETCNMFFRVFREKNVNFTVRRSKGKDISAACGQLINRRKY
jgi:23S rRNA (adenine2503-C2)-methyltransferase